MKKYSIHQVSLIRMSATHSRIKKGSNTTMLFLLFSIFLFSVDVAEASTLCNYSEQPSPLMSFLEKIQKTAHATFKEPNFDPKAYMDVSLKFNLAKTEDAFDKLSKSSTGSVSTSDYRKFSNEYLNEAGADLVYYEPDDFVPEPVDFLPKVERAEIRAWAIEVHALWKNLSRRVADDVKENPELHTLLPLPKPMIIPGSRFLEVYYWDSYWVIRGLLVSKMYETAKSIVYNLIYLIDQYGHVLNGARAYYINRSQPPLLSSMVWEIYNATNDISFVSSSLPALLKEHKFWNSGFHKVTIQDDKGCNHTLCRYFAMWNKPRPETSTIDIKTASRFTSVPEKQHFYRQLASTAEAGWDFSTRWMRNHTDLTTLATTSIVPVDLNAYVLKMELDIVFLARTMGQNGIADKFSIASQARKKAIMSILWSDKRGQWLDYWLTNGSTYEGVHKYEARNHNENTFVSNFIPVWIELFSSDDAIVKKVVKSLRRSSLIRAAGIATSLTRSGQQMDYPNGWAPLQHMIVEGFTRSNSKEAKSMAEDIVMKWMKTNYAAYKKTGTMHEKYDVESCGAVGGGGEYIPQTGFGWTNGVALAFLEEFGWPKYQKINC